MQIEVERARFVCPLDILGLPVMFLDHPPYSRQFTDLVVAEFHRIHERWIDVLPAVGALMGAIGLLGSGDLSLLPRVLLAYNLQ